MRISWKQPALWAAIFIATLYNLAIIREAATIPFLRGSHLAQADLSLFLTLIFFGIPVLITCLVVLIITLAGIRRVKREGNSPFTIRAIALKNPLVLVTLCNISTQGLVWVFMLYIMQYGLDTVTDWTR